MGAADGRVPAYGRVCDRARGPNTSGDATVGRLCLALCSIAARSADATSLRSSPFTSFLVCEFRYLRPLRTTLNRSAHLARHFLPESRLVTLLPLTCQKPLTSPHAVCSENRSNPRSDSRWYPRPQPPRIAGHGRRIARDIDDSTRALPGDHVHRLSRDSASRRIDDDDVGNLGTAGHVILDAPAIARIADPYGVAFSFRSAALARSPSTAVMPSRPVAASATEKRPTPAYRSRTLPPDCVASSTAPTRSGNRKRLAWKNDPGCRRSWPDPARP